MWRIIAGIYGVANPKFTAAHVPSFLDRVLRLGWIEKIIFERVVDFAMQMLPNDQPWILAVDELIKLPAKKHTVNHILSMCTQWVYLSLGSHLRCVVLTSSTPKLLDFLSTSNRAPICIAPSLLRAESCVAMASELGHNPTNPLVMGAILMAAGHPRALHLDLEYLQSNNALMPVSQLATELHADTFALEDIPLLIAHSFEFQELPRLPKSLRRAAKRGSLLQ